MPRNTLFRRANTQAMTEYFPWAFKPSKSTMVPSNEIELSVEESVVDLLHLVETKQNIHKRNLPAKVVLMHGRAHEAIRDRVHHEKASNVQRHEEELMAGDLRHTNQEFRDAEGNLFDQVCLDGGRARMQIGSLRLLLYHLINIIFCASDVFIWLPWISAFILYKDAETYSKDLTIIPPIIYLLDVGLQVAQLIMLCIRFTISIPDLRLGVEIVDTFIIYRSLMGSQYFWILGVSTVMTSAFLVVFKVSRHLGIGLGMLRVVRFLVITCFMDSTLVRDLGLQSQGFRIGQLVLQVGLAIHLNACAWYFMSFFAPPPDETWSLLKLYCEALNDATYMLAGTPPEATNTRTTRELLYISLVAIVGQLFFAYVLAKFVNMVAQMGILRARQNEHIAMIQAAMQSLDLPLYLKRRIAAYHVFRSVRYNSTAHDVLVCNVSLNLQVELKLFVYRDLLRYTLLTVVYPKYVTDKIVAALVDQIFSPGDIVVNAGEVGHEMYFVVQGAVDVFRENDGMVTVFSTLEFGAHFGEVALVQQQMRTASIRSKTFSILSTLSKTHLDVILLQYPEFDGALEAHLIDFDRKRSMSVDVAEMIIQNISPAQGRIRSHYSEPLQRRESCTTVPDKLQDLGSGKTTFTTPVTQGWMIQELIPGIVHAFTESAQIS